MRKYWTLFSSYFKQSIVYRANALLTAGLSIVTVLLSCLLFRMLIPQGGTLSGFTYPQMVTYSVLSAAITPFFMNNDPIFAFSGEIRSGKFSKYLYTPISPLGAFVTSSLASSLPACALQLIAAFVWGVLLRGAMAPIDASSLAGALCVLLPAVLFTLLMNYAIACLSFRFTDILGVVLIRSTVIQFFSGALAPLEILFGGTPWWSPFTYMAGAPVLMLLGKCGVTPVRGVLVLSMYILPMLALCLYADRSSRRFYEGVGA